MDDSQPDRVGLEVATCFGVVVALVVLVEASGAVVALASVAQVEGEGFAVAIGVFVRLARAKCFALDIPAPNRHVAIWVDHHSRGVEVIGFDIRQFLRATRRLSHRAIAAHHGDWNITESDRLMCRLAYNSMLCISVVFEVLCHFI